MHRTTLLAAAAGITLGAGLLIPAGPASAHHATVSIFSQGCNPNGAFVGTLTIVPTDLDKAPRATVVNPDSPYVVTSFPYSATVTTMSGVAKPYSVTVRWSNGVEAGPYNVTLNPGRTDCTPTGSTTTVPESPTTTVPAGPTTTARICEDGNPPSVVLEDGSIVCPEYGAPVDQPTTTTAAVTGGQAQPPTPRAPIALPATGAGEIATVIGTGVVLALCGVVAVMIDRRKRAHIDR